jgi:hypothetical protein
LEIPSDSESDSDTEQDDQIKIVYRGTSYILYEGNLFTINFDGSRGDLFGSYSNGKVVKNKEIEV